MSLSPKEIHQRLQMMLTVVTSGVNSGRAVGVCLDTLQASMNADVNQSGVILSREIMERLLQEMQNVNNSLRVVHEYYIKNVEALRLAVENPNVSQAQAQAELRRTFAEKQAATAPVTTVSAIPAAEIVPESRPAPTLTLPAAPVNPSPEDLTPAVVPVGIGGALDARERNVLNQNYDRVPESPFAQLEFPSTSPVARYFYTPDGVYQQREGFPRVHIDPGTMEVSDWLTGLPEGAYGAKNAVDDFDTPTAIVVRMDEAGIALMWNPVNNSYRIFFMELNLDATMSQGFRHRWLSHKNFTQSHLKVIMGHLNRRLGFTA